MSINAHDMLKKIQTILRLEGLYSVTRRALAKLLRESGVCYEEAVARRKGSYSLNAESIATKLTSRLDTAAIGALSVEQCIPQQVAQHYLDHRFDLLGSGWVQVRYGMHVRGMAGYRYDMNEGVVPDPQGQWLTDRANPSNLAIAQRTWQRVDHNYQPIDWQLDFKSGYRWSEKNWAMRLPYGHLLGVDVKVPWELSRMHHLPQMALRASALGLNDADAQQLVREIRNQWLDFIATNPPGFGVNWLCRMDIAIRGANWCLAWDILQAAGFALDPEDETAMAHSLYDHGRYIVGHLEWSNDRANHYLADICGLAFIAAYLPETRETDHWIAFAIGQLQTETLRQFLQDGGNFEGSTAYHRLSTEMVLYATALILGLPQARLKRLSVIAPKAYAYLPGGAAIPAGWSLNETGTRADGESIQTPFDQRFVERLQRAVSFFAAILKPDGSFPQIGDNDSGRFFKIKPIYSVMTVGEAKQKYLNLDGYEELGEQQPYYLEEHCQGRHLISAASGLGFATVPIPVIADYEYLLIRNLANGTKFTSQVLTEFSDSEGLNGVIDELYKRIGEHPKGQVKNYQRQAQGSSGFVSLKYCDFPDFGLHVWRANGLLVTVRSIETDAIHAKCHFHDDQLSMEVTIDGNAVIQDPGTYVYTALPTERNKYRSREVHFSSLSANPQTLAVFEPPSIIPVHKLYVGIDGFAGMYVEAGSTDQVVLRIKERSVELLTLTEIQDESQESRLLKEVSVPPFSPGYGIQERI